MTRSKQPISAPSSPSRTARAKQAIDRRRASHAKAIQARQLTRRFEQIRDLHRGNVAAAQRPIAPLEPVNERAIRAKHLKAAMGGGRTFDRSEREAAKERAEAPAQQEIALQRARASAEQVETQADLDRTWALLRRNDPEVVLGTLKEAFAASATPASPVSVNGEEVELAVLVPGLNAVPEQIPSAGPGVIVLRSLSATERASHYGLLVCGHLLATLREAFAAAPGLASARIAALRATGDDSYGKPVVECLMAGRFTRKALEGIAWANARSSEIVGAASTGLITNLDRETKTLRPVGLAGQPGLAAMIGRVDLAALVVASKPPPPKHRVRRAAGAPIWGRPGKPWPDLGRAREVGGDWYGARSRTQRIVLIVATVLVLLMGLGALTAKPKQTSNINSAGPAPTAEKPAKVTTSKAPKAAPSSTEPDEEGVPAGGPVGPVVVPATPPAAPASSCRPGDPLANVYHPDRLKVVTACTTVTGTVAIIRSEADGDVHFNLTLDGPYANLINDQNRSQEHGQLVVEIVPADRPGCAPGAAPRAAVGTYDYGTCSGAAVATPALNSHVSVTGPYVLDSFHGWMEIHPAWSITAVSDPPQPPGTNATVTTRAPAPPPTSPPAPAPATTAAPTATRACNATISNASPVDNSTVTVRITSAPPNVSASATAHYKTKDTTNPGMTDAAGSGSIDFKISRATVGFQVVVDVTAGGSSCQTSFTPR